MFLDPDRSKLATHWDWYEGNLRTLFQIHPTAINGLGLIGVENVGTQFNYLQALSRFYSAAVTSDLPRLDPGLANLIQRCAEHWSVTSECVLIRGPQRVRAVRPDYVFPISDPYDQELIERFIFVFPYRDTQQGAWDNRVISSTRATVIEYFTDTRQAFRSIRDYRPGEIADSPKGEPVDIGEVIWVKSGEPPYVTVESQVREICVRLNMLQLALNTTSLPLIQLDKDSVADGELRGGNTSLDVVKRLATSPLGMNLTPPFSGEEGARYIERTGTGLQESLDYVRLLLGQLGVLSGVPDYVFGVQLGRPNNETERVLFAGQARVNSFRRSLEEALAQVGFSVKFASEPFVTRAERLANIILQFEKGVISREEAREALGYGA